MTESTITTGSTLGVERGDVVAISDGRRLGLLVRLWRMIFPKRFEGTFVVVNVISSTAVVVEDHFAYEWRAVLESWERSKCIVMDRIKEGRR